MRYAYFLHLRATPAWLRLPRDQRRALAAEHLGPLQADPACPRLRWFDAEAFTTDCTDVLLVETDDPWRHHVFIERLRDTPLVHAPYFEFVRIVPTIEEGFQAFEAQDGGAGLSPPDAAAGRTG